MAVAHFLLLSSLGLAITIQAQNCPPPEGGENMSLRGDHILVTTFPEGTRVTFTCNPGYVSAGGSASITCTAGTWSPIRLKCERRSCGSFGDVPNGQVDYPEGILFGDKLVITCNEGYRLVGKSRISCGAQGWEDRAPECEVVICVGPPVVANGYYSPTKDSYEYREVVQYTCQKDYTLVGSRSLSCSADETFEPAPPTCTKVQCRDPMIQDAEWYGGSRPPHGYKATVTYRCISGYTMIGSGTLTCELNNEWSPGIPECKRTTTKATPTTTTTTTTTTKDPAALSPTTTVAHTTASTTPSTTTLSEPCDNAKKIGLGVGLAALIGSVITACVCYFCGVPACIKEKRSRGSYPDNVAPKDGEDVALS